MSRLTHCQPSLPLLPHIILTCQQCDLPSAGLWLICIGNSPRSLWELYLPKVMNSDTWIWWEPESAQYQDQGSEAAITKAGRMNRLQCHPRKLSNPILSKKGSRDLVPFAIPFAVVPLYDTTCCSHSTWNWGVLRASTMSSAPCSGRTDG